MRFRKAAEDAANAMRRTGQKAAGVGVRGTKKVAETVANRGGQAVTGTVKRGKQLTDVVTDQKCPSWRMTC